MSQNTSLYAILSESAEPTQVTAQYVWGARPGHRDELVRRDGDADGDGTLDERLYCLMDYFNPTAIVDETGTVVERYGWSPFGARTVMDADWTERSSSAYAFDFGFHGQFLDDETGFYDYGFRYYMPDTGRWASRDPIGEEGGINLYTIGANSLINVNDFLGAKVIKVAFLGAGQRENDDSAWPTAIRQAGAKIFRDQLEIDKALSYIVDQLPDQDSKADDGQCCGTKIRIVGFSWGGWSALILARRLQRTRRIRHSSCRKVEILGTLDPVDTGRLRARDGVVPENVELAINIYQTNGCIRTPYRGCRPFGGNDGEKYKGEALVGAHNVDVSKRGRELWPDYEVLNFHPVNGVPVSKIPDHLALGWDGFGPSGFAGLESSYAAEIARLLVNHPIA